MVIILDWIGYNAIMNWEHINNLLQYHSTVISHLNDQIKTHSVSMDKFSQITGLCCRFAWEVCPWVCIYLIRVLSTRSINTFTLTTLESASLSAYMRRQGANKSSWNHSKTNQDHLSESYWITKANNEHKMDGQEDIFPVVLLVQLVLITVIVFPEVQWIQHTGVCWPKN